MITQRELKELLDYDPKTGIFKWKKRTNNGMREDLIAGGDVNGSSKYGYMQLNNKKYLAHRIAWIYIYGRISSEIEIDHINGKKRDNRICNLRLATSSQNSHNSSKPIRNTSGYKGVSFSKRDEKWSVRICHNYKHKFLGHFEDKEKAAHAYDVAALDLHGKFAKTNFDWQEY